MRKVDVERGYHRKPKEREGYNIEIYYCECGCKKSFYHYVEIKSANRLKKIAFKAYLFPEGNFSVFDIKGKQIPHLQGTYSIDLHKRILLEALDDCKFKGFDILPVGFISHAYDWAVYFRKQNMSFEEIEAL